MRIAQIAPLAERVPPRLYGGTERVVSALTEELVRRGHDVTLFASGDSRTRATLVPITARALRRDSVRADPHIYRLLQLGAVFERATDFDIIHSHLDYHALPFGRLVRTPLVTTQHGRLDLPGLGALFRCYPEAPQVSVSAGQRRPLARANWVATVHNGLDLAPRRSGDGGTGGYLAFLGRVSPEKNLAGAVAIARRAGIPLKIAAKIGAADRAYYEARLRPLIDGRFIEYVGEIGDGEKRAFLGAAEALLFPVRWPEPFGLAMIEAMACGTPVLALRRGAVPEVVEDGVTGFVRDTEEELAEAMWQLPALDRAACRRRVEEHFSAAAMADGYEAVYRALTAGK
jgi:glycosyltransferase involved in cell wall biosynthesis